MKELFVRVVKCGELITMPSEKCESGLFHKREIHLKRLGGKYSDELVATLLGKDATCNFYPGDCMMVTLKATVNEHNGKWYQEVTVTDFVKLNK